LGSPSEEAVVPRGRAQALVGSTFGLEEEYHVLDAETFALHDDDALVTAVAEGRIGSRVHAEIATTQLEIATDVCRTLDELRGELATSRREAAAAAASAGGVIMAASTHPFASWRDQRLTCRPRYLTMLERWGVLALQQVICGCHVHVNVPDLDTAVAVIDHARPYLSVLLAMTGSSPFHEGTDTGYDSYRTEWFARWPVAGPAEALGDKAAYLSLVQDLKAAGVIDDASHLYWDVRPSVRYPTLEFRVADVCTDIDDAVLHAALVRSLCRVLARRVRTGEAPLAVRSEVLRAARWCAARYGLRERLLDVRAGRLVRAVDAVRGLLGELREDLEDSGEWDEVEGMALRLMARGTSSQHQRSWLHDGVGEPQIAQRLAHATLVGL
jgi:glutamate---cysteine ligase / carboxylate-amine ligase